MSIFSDIQLPIAVRLTTVEQRTDFIRQYLAEERAKGNVLTSSQVPKRPGDEWNYFFTNEEIDDYAAQYSAELSMNMQTYANWIGTATTIVPSVYYDNINANKFPPHSLISVMTDKSKYSELDRYGYGHELALINEWQYKVDPFPLIDVGNAFTADFIKQLYNFPVLLLQAMVKLTVSPDRIDLISNTKSALFYALVADVIITPDLDPTNEKFKLKWNHLTKSQPRELYLLEHAIAERYNKVADITGNPSMTYGSSFYMNLFNDKLDGIIRLHQFLLDNTYKIKEFYNHLVEGDVTVIDNPKYTEVNRYVSTIGRFPLAQEPLYKPGEFGYIPRVGGLLVYKEAGKDFEETHIIRDFYDSIGNLLYTFNMYSIDRPPLALLFDARDNKEIQELRVAWYSFQEVLEFYLPFYLTDTRLHLDKIRRFATLNDLWTYVISGYETDGRIWMVTNVDQCSNDDSYDVMAGMTKKQARDEQRQISKISPSKNDPTLVYMPKIYGARRRCFLVSELMSSFRGTENGFEFLDPDYVDPSGTYGSGRVAVMDPTTGKPLERAFPNVMIKQLFSHLKGRKRNRDRGYIQNSTFYEKGDETRNSYTLDRLVELHDVMLRGMRERASNQAYLTSQVKLIREHPEWRNDLLIYFGWMFLFAMWIRFWRGPGTLYPTRWKENREGTCEYRQRDQHINIELSVHGELMLRLEKEHPQLDGYIKNLPFLHFEWSTGVITKPNEETAMRLMGVWQLEGLIDKIQFGTFCMAQGTDILTGTAFVYLTEILKVPRERMSELLVQVMRLLYQYEDFAINSRSRIVEATADMAVDERQISLSTIADHRRILTVVEPGFIQPPLDLSDINETEHLMQGFGDILGEM